MNVTLVSGDAPKLHVEVVRVPMGRPLSWLYQGWQDMRRNWGASLGYGALIVALGWTVLMFCGTHPYYVAAAISGFLLVAPVISAGFTEMSRRYSAGQAASFDDSLDGFVRNFGHLSAFGAMLATCAIVWFSASALLLGSVFHVQAPSMQETLYRGFVDSMNLAQVEAFVAVGGVLAAAVFMLSVVSVPLIIDQGATAGQALRASLRVAVTNIPAMILWSALILALTVIGYAPLLCGLLIVSPLLGHSTWHAYRDLVR
jgi:uncharacterized membrane protein